MDDETTINYPAKISVIGVSSWDLKCLLHGPTPGSVSE